MYVNELGLKLIYLCSVLIQVDDRHTPTTTDESAYLQKVDVCMLKKVIQITLRPTSKEPNLSSPNK